MTLIFNGQTWDSKLSWCPPSVHAQIIGMKMRGEVSWLQAKELLGHMERIWYGWWSKAHESR